MKIIFAIIKAMRPKQWVKNIFLFAALVFAKEYGNPNAWLNASLGFAAFCMVSSSGYIFNDARDKDADAKHPKKKFRAIASGELPLKVAYVEMVLLFFVGMGLAYSVSPWLFALALAYYINTMSYSFYFKHFVILDVMFIAMGFLWRVAAGAIAMLCVNNDEGEPDRVSAVGVRMGYNEQAENINIPVMMVSFNSGAILAASAKMAITIRTSASLADAIKNHQ